MLKKIKIILILILALCISYALINYLPYWDEAVYTNNGKFIYSAGKISTYEYQRPPMMGILIGFFWMINFNEVLFTKIILSLIFVIGLFYLYKISEDIKENSGIVTVLLYSSLSSIVVFTNRLLTEIPGASLSIIGYYFFTKKKYFQSGIFLALAFLFRYTSGLVFGVIGLFLLIELLKERKTINFKNILSYGGGFSLLIIPFIVINYVLLKKITGSFFIKIITPFLHASQMVAANAYDLATNGFIYYLKYLISQNYLLVIIGITILMAFVFKKTRKLFLEKKVFIPFIIAIVYYVYISSLVHFEPRYFFSVLPFFVMIGGFGIMELLEKIKLKKWIVFIELLLLVILIFNFSYAINIQIKNNRATNFQEIDEYYTFIQKNDPEFKGLIAVDNPLYGMYNEKNKIVYLSGTYYAEKVIKENKPIKYILYEKRNLECWREEDKECFEKLEMFNKLISEEYSLVYSANFQSTEQYIYRLN